MLKQNGRYQRFIIRNSSRRRRRFWVVVMYAGLAGWIGCNIVSTGTSAFQTATSWMPWWLLPALSFVAMLYWILGFFTVAGTVAYTLSGPLVFKVVTEPEERKPDERQRAVWHRAGYLAWIVTACVLMAAYVYWTLAVGFRLSLLPVPRTEVLLWLFAGAIILIGSLPSAIIALTEPDAERSEDA